MLRLTAGVMLGLLFLIGPLADLFRSSMPAARLAAITAGFALFLALYASAMRAGRAVRLGPEATLAGLAALAPSGRDACAGAPSSFDLLFIFFVAAAGMRLQPRAAVVVVVTAGVGLAVRAGGGQQHATAPRCSPSSRSAR